MAVSYKSQVFESNPYVIPVDLGLLAKVNNYKQSLFYKNAEKVKGDLEQLNNYDIANAEQKQLLTNKTANLSTQLNNMGAIDYSDMNITNQIEGFAGDIVSDSRIMNGIVSTKNIRAFESNVEKMATDPKLSKYYNTSNITRIREQQISPYLKGDVNATYTGPKAPRPYEGNPFEKMLKAMKNLPPDVEVRADASGSPALYKISTNTRLSAEDISATFDGLIDANTAAQLRDDTWFNFDYNTDYKFTKERGQQLYTDDLLNKKNNYDAAVSAIDIELKTTIDPAKRKELEQTKAEYTNNLLPKLNSEIQRGNNSFGKLWDEDQENAKYSLYVGKMRSDVIKAVGYNKEKIDYQKNEEWAFERRKELEYLKHGLQLNSDGTSSAITGWPTSKKKDKNGNDIEDPTQSLSGFGQVGTTNRNATETEAQAVNATTITTQINDLKTQNNVATQAFIKDFVVANNWQETMGYKQNVNTNGIGDNQTLSSDLITKITGTDSNLDINDFKRIIKQTDQRYAAGFVNAKGIDTRTGKPYVYNILHDGRGISMTFQQVKILNQLKTAWEDFGEGKTNKLPDSFNRGTVKTDWMNFATQHQRRDLAAKAGEKYITEVNNLTYKGTNLTPQEQALYTDYLENFDKYKDVSVLTEKVRWRDHKAGAIIESIEKRGLSESKVKELQKQAFATASKALNYYEVSLSEDPKDLPKGLVNTILDRANSSQGYWDLGEDKSLNAKSKITPLKISIADDGKNYKVSYTHDKDDRSKPLAIIITPQEARGFGLKLPSNPELETLFRFGEQESPKLFINNPKFEQPLFYKIKKRSNDFQPFFIYQGQEYPIPLQVPANLASDAEDQFKTLMSQPFSSYENLIAAMKQQKIIPQ